MSNDSKALATINNAGGGELAELGSMSVQTIVDRKRKIREVLENVMTEGEHYGTIPGCGDKPSLFKAGAEVLATTFGLAPTFKITRTDLANGHREYEIVCTLHHVATGTVLGEGVGVCSTMESKYRWRRGERKCPSCGKATIIKGKEEYGGGWLCYAKKGGCGAKFADGDRAIEGQEVGRIENPDVADVYNTVLKIAKKRAQVDCTLTAVGASDVLTQDLEDLPPGSGDRPDRRDDSHGEPSPRDERRTSTKASAPRTGKAQSSGKTIIESEVDPGPHPPDPLTHDEIEDLVEQLARCGTEKALNALAARTKPRVDITGKAVIERMQRVYNEQLAQIRQAEASERGGRRRAS